LTARPRLTARTFYARVFALVAGGLAGGLAIAVLLPIWQPLVWAFLLAALLLPVQHRLAALLGGRPGLAAALLTVATFVVVAPSRAWWRRSAPSSPPWRSV
jgi:predicted PurR-regulated permease PerM